MQEIYGICNGPVVCVHGGAGLQDPQGDKLFAATTELETFAAAGLQSLLKGENPIEVVVQLLRRLELSETFNAGRGSALQADGAARLTAALMDSRRETLSGVIGVQHVTHPSELALLLQNRSAKVVAYPGTELLAREAAVPVKSNITPYRASRWQARLDQSGVDPFTSDTVGVVVLSRDGVLAAGTSTGGRGFEYPGRVSDAATVAGTYCSKFAGISCTGVGEEIVDDALAARMETRCRDGAKFQDASHKAFQEAAERKRSYGWIGVDIAGNWGVAHVSPAMSFAVASEKGIEASSKQKRS